jgi:hypothetical protein
VLIKIDPTLFIGFVLASGLLCAHGILYFLILARITKAGFRRRVMVSVTDMIDYYKTYYRVAPDNSWSRAPVVLSVTFLVLSLCIGFGAFLIPK